jgi:superfamily II DNA or RNA helicase
MFVLHGNWSQQRLHLWAESAVRLESSEEVEGGAGASHPFGAEGVEVRRLLGQMRIAVEAFEDSRLTLELPSHEGAPLASPSLAHSIGFAATAERPLEPVLHRFEVATVAVPPAEVISLLAQLDDAEESPELRQGASLCFWCVAGRLAHSLLTHQRFVPMLLETSVGDLQAAWQPWLVADEAIEQVSVLLRSMPGVARAVVDEHEHDSWEVLDSFLRAAVDAGVRQSLRSERMYEAIEGRDPAADAHVAWLTGLLDEPDAVASANGQTTQMVRTVRHWIAQLDEHGADSVFRLCLRLDEPTAPKLGDLQAPDDSVTWQVSFSLQSAEHAAAELPAEEIWAGPTDAVIVDGHRIDQPQELLLGELGRASRVWPRLEEALAESAPESILLTTREAYQFLREFRLLLLESDIAVIQPEWWDNPAARLGARLLIDSDEKPPEPEAGSPGASSASSSHLGLQALVRYSWQIALGEHVLSLKEFEALATQGSPLVRAGDKWVEIRPEDMGRAVAFISENPGGETTVFEAIRLAYASDAGKTGLPVLGLSARGWVGSLFGDEGGPTRLHMLETPKNFHGELRPYQEKGLSWLAFLDQLGFGACLADDMGLGKTIQLLALLLYEREALGMLDDEQGEARRLRNPLKPNLLIVPMSVVSNWLRETNRFAPKLRPLVHHGAERLSGAAFAKAAVDHDLVITTYALAHRDTAHLQLVDWGRVVLDEAQNVKNPQSKQALAIRAFKADRRIALTGTPVENRLQELWSIIDFCNPGYLGKLPEFRRRFAIPIERYRKQDLAAKLRGMVRPFVLRRLKTDPTVIADLPDKIEAKEYVQLTSEQAKLYEQTVEQMLGDVDRSQGIRRRGIVLATLIKLKQICNHPAQLFKQTAHGTSIDSAQLHTGPPPKYSRSGKCIRICEILDELLAEGDQALVFTQFRQMGHLLAAMLRHRLDREVLFLHGGVPAKKRQDMIDRFQEKDGSTPIFILSLKAGGFGLNLTAANHVIHFDRWWNPAVENQATDRAFRIGQTQTVFVHKFICAGTLEERIDQMIERKMELADNIVGSGEDWLTELSTAELRDLLQLRPEAVSSDIEEEA